MATVSQTDPTPDFVADYSSRGARVGLCFGAVIAVIVSIWVALSCRFDPQASVGADLGAGLGSCLGCIGIGWVVGATVAKVRQHLNERPHPPPKEHPEHQKL